MIVFKHMTLFLFNILSSLFILNTYSNSTKAEYNTKLLKLDDDISSIKKELKECVNKLDNYTKTTDEVSSETDELNSDIHVLKEQIQNIKDQTDNLNTLIENLKQVSFNKEKEINEFISSHYTVM
jgi:uncharacterized coiled-coil DUF342 family protein